MANLSLIKNLVACGAGASMGTGELGCKPFFKKVVSAWLLPQGTVFDDAQEMGLTYVNTLIGGGELIPLNGIRNFVDNTPDDVTEELEDGTKVYIRGAKYEFDIDFINGLYFHAALHSLSGYAGYDVVMVDREGNLLGTQDSVTGQFKGITIGMFQAKKLKFGDDTTQQREGFMMQLLNRNEVDTNYVFIDKNSLVDGFDPTSVAGVNQLNIVLTTPSAGTSLTAKVTRKQDGAPVSGLIFSDFRGTLNGVTSNPTVDDSEATGAGIYVLTVPTLASTDVVTLEVYDLSNNDPVIEKTGVLYKSNTPSATVV